MKFLFLSVFVFLAACETPTLNTSQEFFIDVVGTDEAYCIVSSPHHRYAINAPGRTIIERPADDLKVDCRDNAIQRRRTMAISSDWDGLYYRYPETVIVDFSSLDSGSRYNGYRAPAPEIQKKSIIADKADKREPVLEETSKKEIPRIKFL